jgi:hypothetical protein
MSIAASWSGPARDPFRDPLSQSPLWDPEPRFGIVSEWLRITGPNCLHL